MERAQWVQVLKQINHRIRIYKELAEKAVTQAARHEAVQNLKFYQEQKAAHMTRYSQVGK